MAETIDGGRAADPGTAPAPRGRDLFWPVRTALGVLRRPAEFYESIRGETGLRRCLTFSMTALSLAGAVLWIPGLFLHESVLTPLFLALYFLLLGILAPFVGGMIVWVVGRLLGGRLGYAASVRVAAYAYAVAPVVVGLVLAFGAVGVLAALYGFFLLLTGTKVLSAEPPAAPAPEP